MKFSYVTETKQFFTSLGLYIAVVVGGSVVVLVGSEFLGYLPYSDRPGPGWVGWFPVTSLRDAWQIAQFGLSFGALCVLPAAIYGTPLVLLARLLEWLKVRRLFIAALSGLVGAVVSQLVIGGVGWLIAIGWVPVIASALLGFFYGAWLLPRRPKLQVA